MRIPAAPPDITSVIEKLPPEQLGKVFSDIGQPQAGYLHWDELRRRPTPAGIDHELWWVRTKVARQSQYKRLPLLDKKGRPFVMASPEQLQIDLHHIDRDAAGKIAAPGEVTGEHRDRFLLHSMIEESITSSQLEGASTTRKVAEKMLREGRRPRDTSERMIFNNFQAMEWIREVRQEPITPDRILELHRLLTEGTFDNPDDAGQLRRADDVLVVDARDHTELHSPPSWKELPERLDRLCAFANMTENDTPFVHPVARAILLHFMMGYDHPFADGNGRTARALFYWAMARSGYWLVEFLSISQFLRQAPSKYVRAYLHTETDDNDTTYFLLHQTHIIRRAISALYDYLRETAEEQRQTERLLSASRTLRTKINHRQKVLLTHALKHPGDEYRVDSHQKTHGVVYQTARTDLLELESLGLLLKEKHGNAYVFLAPTDLAERIARLAQEIEGGGPRGGGQ